MTTKDVRFGLNNLRKNLLIWVMTLTALLAGMLTVNPNEGAYAVDPTATPDIFEVTPAAGPAGTDIVITGADFFGTNGSTLEVYFIETNGDSTEATISASTATTISIEAPSDVSGTIDVKVETPVGSVVINDAFRYRAELTKPSLTSIVPSTIPMSGNKEVVITGLRFTEVESVEFDGVDAISYRVESATRIVAVAPPASDGGSARVEVTNSADVSTSVLNLNYADPCEIGDYADIRFGYRTSTLTKETRAEIRAAVRQMVMAECSAVTIHRYSAKLTSSSSAAHRSYVALQKARATAVGDLVSKRLEILGSTAQVRYAKFIDQVSQANVSNWDGKKSYRKITLAHRGATVAAVTSSYPKIGATSGGTVVTLKGANLDKVTGVKFGTTTASFSVIDDDEIEVITPEKTASIVDITLTSPTRTVVWQDAFRFVGEAEITDTNISISNIGGGATVTIDGKNFYGLDNFDSIEFGDVAALAFTVTPTRIYAVIPPNAAGDQDLSVDAIGGSTEIDFDYRYAPKISTVEPDEATVNLAPAADVVITGANFFESVAFKAGGTVASIKTVNNAGTQVTIDDSAFPKKSSTGAVDVEISTTGGKAILKVSFTYTAAP